MSLAALPKVPKVRRKIWSIQTFREAVKAAEDNLLSICMHLAFSCSMRIGEITSLTWKDVIIDEESIATNNAKVIINKELSRINAEAMQKLKEFLRSAYNDYTLVIALDNGNPVESRIVRDRFQKLYEENDYEIVVFHSLRHLSTGYKLKMTNGDVIKSVQGDTGLTDSDMARLEFLSRDERTAFKANTPKVVFQKC